ncbi:hypothetical protein EON83_20385 [bacterium]|nr:MAG: hypothetical protein EON83_20385 [bacterium]
MSVILTIHGVYGPWGETEGLEEAAAHVRRTPYLLAATRRFYERPKKPAQGGETPSKPEIYPASSAKMSESNSPTVTLAPLTNCESSKAPKKKAPPSSPAKSRKRGSKSTFSATAP